MKYRLLLFDKDRYIERFINSDTEREIEPFSFGKNEDGHIFLVLPNEYEALSTKGRSLITVGSDEKCNIRVQGLGVRATISDGNIRSDQNVYVNGIKTPNVSLVPGDKILIGTLEIIYHEDWLEICGVRGDTFDTDLMTKIDMPERFGEFPIYKRSPRVVKAEPHTKVQIKAPEKPEKQKKGELVKQILPSCVMIVATVLMSMFMNRGMFMLVMVAATGATMIITVVTHFDDRKTRKAEEKERKISYNEYLLAKRKELFARTEEYKDAVSYQNLKLNEIESEVRSYSGRIYERNINDDDFLTVSLGTAPGEPSFKIECELDDFGRKEEKQYREMLSVYNNFRIVDNIPYVIDLKKSHLGIVGRPDYARERLRDIATQIAFFQSYHDVCIVPVVGEENKAEYDWMRYLPHTEIRSINVSSVITSENQRDQVLGHITRELKARSMTRDESKKETRFAPHYVFIIDEPKLIINHSIMEHLKEEGSDLGFTLIFTTQLENNLPENVKTILEIEAKAEGTVIMNEGFLAYKKIGFDESEIDFETLARRLKPIIHNKGVTTQIPESISFLDLYDAKTVEDIDIKSLWGRNATHKSLSVPLGVRGKGDIVNLDLHERAHGPHGLVAGTTGSGKSEILQSYILSLACNFHPHDVGFLLIDYKGGGMANLFTDLPHLLGTITNLDGSESMRALASIKSELKRRQDVFNKNGVNNINKYSEKFRAGEASEPMPHLFIISDEFAELKKEQPEFMAELVSTARVGRSLGVHLILATQKPTGVVDDQIWSNSRFKLCLKVQDESDSRELLKTGDAANITQPGRAYLQVGNNEIFELFQSAYSGGIYGTESEGSGVDDRIYVINELGQGKLINGDLSRGEESTVGKLTQLDAVVQRIKKIYEEEPCTQVEKPWLPPLAEEIVNTKIMSYVAGTRPDVSFDVGIIDMPDRQAQDVYTHNFAKSGNMVLFGTSKVGKSTAATNLILSLAAKNTPESLNMYIVDFGNAALFGLKSLPQVADYISFDDEEKFRKLRNLLSDEISERKRKFAKANVTTLEMYNDSAVEKLPAILIVIDNYDIVKEISYELEDYFTQLTRDGIGVGIYTFATATRANAMRYAVLNNFGARICNFLSDDSEITSLIGRSEYKLFDIKGRALVARDNVYLMQEYVPAPISDPIIYRDSIADMVSEISARSSSRARAIPMLPDKLEAYDLIKRKGDDGRTEDVAIGLDSEIVDVVYLEKPGITLVLGPSGAGKTELLKHICAQIDTSRLHVSDSKKAELHMLKEDLGERYISTADDDLEGFIRKLDAMASKREARYLASDKTKSAKQFYQELPNEYIVIDDAMWLAEIASDYSSTLSKAIDKAVTTDVRIVVSADSKKMPVVAMDEFTKMIKGADRGILLGSIEQNVFNLGLLKIEMDEDIAIVCDSGNITKIKIPKAEA